MAQIKITVDGKVVYNGDCIDGCYVYRFPDEKVHHTSQPFVVRHDIPKIVDPVLIDFLESGYVQGVEILAPIDTRKETK